MRFFTFLVLILILNSTTDSISLFPMAYKTRTENNENLVKGLRANGILKSPVVEEIMRKVDRGDYSSNKDEAYNDNPHSIGYGQTISAPHMHALCLEVLESKITKPDAKVLDVGSGSGYLSACFGRMIGEGGKVLAIDVVPELVNWATKNIKKHDGDLLEDGTVTIKLGDGWKGEPSLGPFDAIHVGAAAETLPQALVDQLAPGGRLVIPVGHQYSSQKLLQVDKSMNGVVTKKNLLEVQYVPLVKR